MKLHFIFFLIFLLACSRYEGPVEEIPDRFDASLNYPFELRINQTAHIPAESLDISIVDVRDTRCPDPETCDLLGDVEVDFKMSIGGVGFKEFTIRQFDENSYESFSQEGYTINLARVLPYPETEDPIPLEDYRVRVLVTELVS